MYKIPILIILKPIFASIQTAQVLINYVKFCKHKIA